MKRYVSEAARAIKAMGEACTELVGAATVQPAGEKVQAALRWYRDYALPLSRKCLQRNGRKGTERPYVEHHQQGSAWHDTGGAFATWPVWHRASNASRPDS
jgi:hypothetical protein